MCAYHVMFQKGIVCDYCRRRNFMGTRFKCLICQDYDLCGECFARNFHSSEHLSTHPMQGILTRADLELYYAGEKLPKYQMAATFTCPICSELGFSIATLLEHVAEKHLTNTTEVLCPICVSNQLYEARETVDNLSLHLVLEHRSNIKKVRFTERWIELGNSFKQRFSERNLADITRAPIQLTTATSTKVTKKQNGGNKESLREFMSNALNELPRFAGNEHSSQAVKALLESDINFALVTGRNEELRRFVARSFHSMLLDNDSSQKQKTILIKIFPSNLSCASESTRIGTSTTINASNKLRSCIKFTPHDFLLPKLLNSINGKTDELKVLCERIERAEFIKSLLLSMLSIQELQKITQVKVEEKNSTSTEKTKKTNPIEKEEKTEETGTKQQTQELGANNLERTEL